MAVSSSIGSNLFDILVSARIALLLRSIFACIPHFELSIGGF